MACFELDQGFLHRSSWNQETAYTFTQLSHFSVLPCQRLLKTTVWQTQDLTSSKKHVLSCH